MSDPPWWRFWHRPENGHLAAQVDELSREAERLRAACDRAEQRVRQADLEASQAREQFRSLSGQRDQQVIQESELRESLHGLQVRIDEVTAERDTARERCQELEEECRELRAQSQVVRPTAATSPPPGAAVVIDLADRLDEVLAQRDEPGADVIPVLAWARGQVDSLLALAELTVCADEGAIDPQRHQVIGTVATDDPALAGQIAATARVGYLWRGRLVRPQAVQMFACTDPAAT